MVAQGARVWTASCVENWRIAAAVRVNAVMVLIASLGGVCSVGGKGC